MPLILAAPAASFGVPLTHVCFHDCWGILRGINATIGLGSHVRQPDTTKVSYQRFEPPTQTVRR